jgi:diguanylate cyclase (GGDEF)-like protein/PAS domain S-box-containing protein
LLSDENHISSERLSAIAESIPGVVYQRIVTPDGNIRYTYISEGARDLFGVSPEEILKDPNALFDIFTPEYHATFRERLLTAARELKMWDVEASIITREGQLKYTHAIARPSLQEDGSVVFDGVILDATRSRQAEIMVQHLGRILDRSSNEVYVFKNDDLKFLQVNQSAVDNLKYTHDELLLMTPMELATDFGDDLLSRFLEQLRSEKQSEISFETTHRRKDGTMYPVDVTLQISREQSPPCFVAIVQDISERKRAEDHIRRQASFDALTGLPNRTVFFDHMTMAIAGSSRYRKTFAVLFLDLDRFKDVNDSLGHIVGDKLLKMVGKRLKTSIRGIDTVARFGGDEFTILLPEISRGHDAAIIAEKILERLSTAFTIEGQDLFVGASIGITVYPHDAGDEITLLRNADMAMYRAKEEGRNTYRFFSPEMSARATKRMQMEGDLRRALAGDELFLLYQPIVSISSGEVTGMEALVRWDHPQHGLISPDEFITLAEETGLIGPIGEWVLGAACRQANAWLREGIPALKLSVNVSSRQLEHGLTGETIARQLAESGLPPASLTLEITESLFMGDSPEAIAWLGAIQELGISLSIDDFGTGFSSLSYLKNIPADYVKIDRSFIIGLAENPKDQAMVKAIVSLAHAMGFQTVVEGVETKEQFEFVKPLGCGYVQGFYYSKPLSVVEFRQFLKDFKGL